MAFETRTAVIVGAAVALVAAGIAGLASLSGEAPPSVPSAYAPTLGPLEAPEMPQQPAPPNASTRVRDVPWSVDDSLATAAAHYRNAKDLREFYDRALAAGGMANTWYALTALSRCTGVSRYGMVGVEQSFAAFSNRSEFDAQRREAWRLWNEPCRKFETRPVPPGELQKLTTKLRDTPGLIGEGFRLSRGDATPGERKAFLRSVVESGNDDVLATFGYEITMLRVGDPKSDGKADSEEFQRLMSVEQTAWAMALCELGRDCTRGSETWVGICTQSAECSENNFEAVVLRDLGPGGLEATRKRKDEYVAAVRARDWAALGL